MAALSSVDPETKYRLLLKISQDLSGTLELQDVLHRLLAAVRGAIPYDAAGIFVLSRRVPIGHEAGPHVIAGMAAVGFADTPRDDDPMLRSGRGIVGHVIRTGERVIAPDVRRDPHYVEGRPSTLSEVAVPIVSNREVIGALNLESDRLDSFSAADAELLEFFAVAAALSIEKAILHEHVLERRRLEQQLAIAREVQASLLPAEAPRLAGYDMAGVNLPTWAIGGDYFDYIPLAGDRMGLVVADVAGKGVPAALIMATFRAALRTELRGTDDLLAVVEAVDRVLLESTDHARFVTAVFGLLDPGSGAFTYVNCGHNPPMLLRAGAGTEILDQGRAALGMLGAWRAETGRTHLAAGDMLVLYTDGVVELTAPDQAEFGVERLESLLRQHAHEPARQMVAAAIEATRAYTGRTGYEDDFTLVVLKRDPSPA